MNNSVTTLGEFTSFAGILYTLMYIGGKPLMFISVYNYTVSLYISVYIVSLYISVYIYSIAVH